MTKYSLYSTVQESIALSAAPSAAVTAAVRYEWGDLVGTFTASVDGSQASISIPGELITAAGMYDIRWSTEVNGEVRRLTSSFVVETQYITEAEFMNIYEDMNTAQYGGDIFVQAESVSRKIIDTFCGQDFQFIGNKTLSREGNDREKLFFGKRLNHIYEASLKVDTRVEDYTDRLKVDYGNRLSVSSDRPIPRFGTLSVNGDWGWTSPPQNIRDAAALLTLDMLEDTRREHHAYGITRMEQDTNRIWFNPTALSESTGNVDVDVLLIDYINWIPDWI